MMTSAKAILQIEAIEKSFPGVKALDKASLSVYPGKVMALVGENGAGKSTLMKILTGIYQRDAGRIVYQGEAVDFPNPKASQQAGISIIHQELNMIGELSIAENIFLGREFTTVLGNIDWPRMIAEADKLLARLGFDYSSKMLTSKLSLGEQQMVEIAKALSFSAKVIIMDEPTDALTDKETEALFAVIEELKAQNCGIVYISHRLPEIFDICDDVTVLRDGCFIAEQPIAALTEATLIESMVGRKLEDQYPHIDQARGEPLMVVDQLSGAGVELASFTLHKGEILGVSGLMGAGRTELMKIIFGALPRTAGSITLEGQRLNHNSPKAGIDNGIAYISEDRKHDGLVLGMSVKENASLSAISAFTKFGKIQSTAERQAVNKFVDAFNIKTPTIRQLVGLLSGGNQQKVAIAKGLLTQPKVLILDEPTRGVDVGAKKEIYDLINQLKADGMGIILISSDMPEVLGMSDRLLTMKGGRITGVFSREDATQEKLLAASISATLPDEALSVA